MIYRGFMYIDHKTSKRNLFINEKIQKGTQLKPHENNWNSWEIIHAVKVINIHSNAIII